LTANARTTSGRSAQGVEEKWGRNAITKGRSGGASGESEVGTDPVKYIDTIAILKDLRRQMNFGFLISWPNHAEAKPKDMVIAYSDT
jgi:hypothetical protein